MSSLLETPVKMSPLLKELLRSPFTEGRAMTSRVWIETLLKILNYLKIGF